MRLFWKFFLVIFVSFFTATLFFSVAVYYRQAAEAERLVVEEVSATSRFIAGELAVRGSRSEWPFESLMTLSQRDGLLFWWVVRDDGVIHLAHQVDFMNTDARPLYPDLIEGEGEQLKLVRQQDYGVLSKSFLVNGKTWHFLIGFTLKGVTAAKQAVVFFVATCFFGALVLLGLFSWFMIRRLIRPVDDLLIGVDRIGRGDLKHRVAVHSRDEIGELAAAFNEMAARLKDVYDNLEAKVNERTKELEAQRVEFISVATHQLKTPITSLKWGAETLQERAGEMAADLRDLVNDMKKAATGMAELVNALLNVSRLELGTNAVIVEPVNLEEELGGVLKLMEKPVSERGLKLEVRIGRTLPQVYDADRQMTIIIFQNLISNAIKYSKDGGMVRIALDKTEAGIVFSVSDDGIGIPEAQQPRLFSKMFRADNAQKIEGTGLGLHIVKRVVENVNGSIEFTSKEGVGSTFTVTLPAAGMPAKAGTRRLT